MCTSAGWAEALEAITAEKECDSGNSEVGNPGDCGKYMAGVAFMIAYLVLSFLIIVNMYIAVILENYSQVGFGASLNVLEGDEKKVHRPSVVIERPNNDDFIN